MAGDLAAGGVLNGKTPFCRHTFSIPENVIYGGLPDAHRDGHGSLAANQVLCAPKCLYALFHTQTIDFSIVLSIETTIRRTNRDFYNNRPMKTLGNRIEERLREIEKSQHWLAEQVNIKQPSIHAIIKGAPGSGSKYLVPISDALGVQPSWLWDGRAPKLPQRPREAVLVGYIGAGDKVFRNEDGVVLEGGIEPPAGYNKAVAARIRGHSMKPLEPGWLVFYEAEYDGDPLLHLNKLCAVGLEDGVTYIKRLTRKNGKFILKSWNADDIVDAKVLWASPVLEIRIV